MTSFKNEKPTGREEKIELYWFNRILDHSTKDKWMGDWDAARERAACVENMRLPVTDNMVL